MTRVNTVKGNPNTVKAANEEHHPKPLVFLEGAAYLTFCSRSLYRSSGAVDSLKNVEHWWTHFFEHEANAALDLARRPGKLLQNHWFFHCFWHGRLRGRPLPHTPSTMLGAPSRIFVPQPCRGGVGGRWVVWVVRRSAPRPFGRTHKNGKYFLVCT